MKTLLIADNSQPFDQALAQALSAQYQVTCCCDGSAAQEHLQALRPDILIISLSLPHLDGLYVLESTQYKPSIILALCTQPSASTLYRAKKAGVAYVFQTPCTVRCVVRHIQTLEELSGQQAPKADPQALVEEQLVRMGIPSHRAGFNQLVVGIPIFAQGEDLLMKEELYPAIAALCGKDDPQLVEHTMRKLLQDVWDDRDRSVWDPFFPNRKKYPSNKVFLKAMARWLRKQ